MLVLKGKFGGVFNSVLFVQRKKERKSKQKEGIKFLKKNKEKK
jgi:hypothetical protein